MLIMPIYILHIMQYIRFRTKTFDEEIHLWKKNWSIDSNGILGLIELLQRFPEFRNLFYFRTPSLLSCILAKLYKGQCALYMPFNSNVGKNLMIWHGFSTIINTERIGDNCSIWQQVTIGNKLDVDGKKPIIGNNVKICAGAIILGDVTIGDNAIVGAGAVVVKDVPKGGIAAGVPAKIIRISNI